MQSLTLESVTSQSPGLLTRLRPWLHVKACTGSLIVLSFIAVGIFGPAAAPLDPNKQELTAMLKAMQPYMENRPDGSHWYLHSSPGSRSRWCLSRV